MRQLSHVNTQSQKPEATACVLVNLRKLREDEDGRQAADIRRVLAVLSARARQAADARHPLRRHAPGAALPGLGDRHAALVVAAGGAGVRLRASLDRPLLRREES